MNRLKIRSTAFIMIILAGCLFQAEVPGQAGTRDQLRETIDKILDEAKFGHPEIGIMIQAGDTGHILYERDAL